jgi:D-alanine-D-alanine ligase
VIHALELLNLPHTGPSALLYDPPKPLMKYVAHTAGVATPDFAVVRAPDLTNFQNLSNLGMLQGEGVSPARHEQVTSRNGEETTGFRDEMSPARASQMTPHAKPYEHLSFPLFVKPVKAGDSLGVNENSLVETPAELRAKVSEIITEYDEALVEEYVAGREFTVLVAADPEPSQPPTAYLPLEFVFPKEKSFKTYDLKIKEWHPECNVPCTDAVLAERLRDAARRIFKAFEGAGYARLDFRVDAAGTIFFLEINFACSVFYPEGHEGSADYILKYDGVGQGGFLRRIIAEGTARWRRKQKCYEVRGNSIAGYGICAVRDIRAGEIVFQGEERSQRIASRSWVEANWSEADKLLFRQYAYPVSEEVFILWDGDPNEWAPQNHSCDPNTAYRGLNVVALRDIAAGEELTLDYALFYNENMEPFECRCGSPKCRGVIRGESREISF